MLSCVLYALNAASAARDVVALEQIVAPAVRGCAWAGFPDDPLLTEAVASVAGWEHPHLRAAAPEISRHLLRGRARGAYRQRGARLLAREASAASVGETVFARELRGLAAARGLPVNPENSGPREFVRLRERARDRGGPATAYLAAAEKCLLLLSKQGSLRPFASGLRAYGAFCDLSRAPHFPVEPRVISQFAATCREPGTYLQYAPHVKAACELIGTPTDWRAGPRVSRAREGLKKASLVFKGPRLAIGRALASRLAINVRFCIPERFFCLLSWVFLLRARSEASFLTRAATANELEDRLTPLEGQGVVGLVGNSLAIRLRPRKSRLGGDTITRSCVCEGGAGVSAHIPRELCPAHELWPWALGRAEAGGALFPPGIADSAGVWLRAALEARNVRDRDKFALRSLRRGAAQALVAQGGDLVTLLKAGGWRGAAFRAYVDVMGVENAILTRGVETLVDLDEGN